MKILVLTPGKNVGAITDFLHRGAAQIVMQLGMAGQNNGQTSPTAVVFDQFEQPLQTSQGMAIEGVGLINEQGYGALALLHQFVQFTIPFFNLGGMRTCLGRTFRSTPIFWLCRPRKASSLVFQGMT
ncbi:TPA: hypothetical protein VDU52_002774 [Pseudomonas aeruginosa]|nr:hypothetical protein [Pseudomonas aeruginosa]